MKKQTLIKGTFVLGVAGVMARFLGLFFRIPMQMLIGDEGMGYYQMSYPLYMTFIAVSSGIPIAVSKIISELNAKDDKQGITSVVSASMYIMIPISILFSTVLVVFAKQIISYLHWDIKSYYGLIATALAPLFVVMIGVYRGFFQGLHNMNSTAVSQILEQLGRVIGGVGLAYILIDYGIEYAAGGAALGALIGAVIGLLYLRFQYKSFIKNDNFISDVSNLDKKKHNKDIKLVVKNILKNAIPFSFGAVIGTIMGLVDSIIVPSRLLRAGVDTRGAAILYGQLTGKASTIANVPLALSMAVCTAIVPIIAEVFSRKDSKELKNKIEMSMKLSCVVAIPAAMGMYFLAYPITNLIFRGDVGGYNILKYMSLSIPFIVMTQCTTTVLQCTNNFYEPIKNLSIGCLVKIILTYFLVSIEGVNIYGAVIGSTIGYIITCILNFRLINGKLNFKINIYKTTIKPSYAATIMSIFVIICNKIMMNYTKSSNIACVIAILVGIIVYSIFIFIFSIFSINEVKTRIKTKIP